MPQDTAHPIQDAPSLLDELGQADRLLGLIRAAEKLSDGMDTFDELPGYLVLTRQDAHALEAVLSASVALAEKLADGIGRKA